MNEQHQREEALFEAALQLPPAERGAYLDKACAGDEQLRQRIESLLKSHEDTSGVLEQVIENKSGLLSTPLSEKPGDRIGRYKLLQQIGEGGCGVVYMAEQEEPVRRRVALKIIKLGMDTKQVMARFEAERQALALMDHPNIAKVFDAGATETGRPYFVMELVRGTRITDYCDENNFSTRQRLDLFIQVCRAIQHAHQKGIIHRDIKPSNILVTLHDGEPSPMVIDFGIAKATGGLRLTDQTFFTAFEQFLGTPAYMSPEQAQLTSLDIDTRSDIYSLGVLLYELLTSKTPFEAKELLQAGLEEMLRTIREKEPARPSTRLSAMLKDELTTTAKHRQTEPPKLVKLLGGDLDWIVMKCLEKNRARRYETANGMAMDIERHLNGEPVAARPPSRFYQFNKMVGRHKFAFIAFSAVLVSLLLGFGISTRLFFMEKSARQRADTEANKSQQVAQFLKNMLQGVGPSVAMGRDTTMLREILDRTAEQVGRTLTNQPEVQAELLNTIGEVYRPIHEYEKAEAVDRWAWGIRQRVFGKSHPAVATSLHNLALDLTWQGGHDAQAEAMMRQALGLRQKLLGESHADVAASLYRLSRIVIHEVTIPAVNIDSTRLTEAEELAREALAIQRTVGNGETPELAICLAHLAELLQLEVATAAESSDAKMGEAENLVREALAIMRKRRGPEQPDTYATMFYISDLLLSRGKFAEAGSAFQEAIAIQRRLWGNEHVLTTSSCLIGVRRFCEQGAVSEGVAVFREQLALIHTNGQFAVETIGQVAADLQGHHKWDLAEQFCRAALSLGFSNQSPAALAAHQGLARVFVHRGRWREATAELTYLPVSEATNEMGLYALASLYVADGNWEQYKRNCQQMITLFGDTNDPDIAGRMAKGSLIVPLSDLDWRAVGKWAETAVASVEPSDQLAYRQFTKGLAEYRQGHFTNSVAWLRKALKNGESINRDDCEVETRMVLAMALYQSKQTDAARIELAKGCEIADTKLPKLESDDLGDNWFDWIIAHTLMREAKMLIDGQPDSVR